MDSPILQTMNEYNTGRLPVILKEYGRNIQKLIEYIKNIEDREDRNNSANTLIELMKQVTPTLRDTPETTQKMWDDLYIMAGFELDIDSPYPIPEKDVLEKKPDRIPYNTQNIRYKHYGKNIELLVSEVIDIEDEQEQQNAIIYIGKLMKSFHASWNKEVIDDEVIVENIRVLSKGKLIIDLEKVREENLFESLYKEKKRSTQSSSKGGNFNSGGPRARNNNSNSNRSSNSNNRRKRS